MAVSVEALSLVKTFEGKRGSEVEAVRGVDLCVESGEVFGFLGPNGVGKSTTVRMLTTLTTITSGVAQLAGVDVASDPDGVRRRNGVALQEVGLDPRQTGREILVLQARLLGLARRRRRPLRRSCSSWWTRPMLPIGARRHNPVTYVMEAMRSLILVNLDWLVIGKGFPGNADETVDYHWAALSAVPESERCGSCKDRFGLSWQVVPASMSELMQKPHGLVRIMRLKRIVDSEC